MLKDLNRYAEKPSKGEDKDGGEDDLLDDLF